MRIVTVMTEALPDSARARPLRIPVREALITAAQELISEEGTGIPIQMICDRAGVAAGSLYNYFSGKDELFLAAAESAIDDMQAYMSVRSATVTDPVERLATDMRLYGRMPDTHPLYARVLTRTSAQVIARPRGYNPDAYDSAQELIAAGRFRCDDVELTLIAAFAAFERIVALRLKDPSIGPERVDDLTAMVLTWLGVSKSKARSVVTRPLPP